MKTLRELAEDLATYDEVDVLELLDLTSEMVINRFMDRVEEREVYLRKELYAEDTGEGLGEMAKEAALEGIGTAMTTMSGIKL